MKNYYLLACLIFCSIFSGCDSNDNNTGEGTPNDSFSENFGNSASRDFIGQVVDQDNNPVQSATVQIGGTSAQTDSNGVFVVYDADVFEKFAYITAKKSGYIDGSRSMVPTTGMNNVKIMLIASVPIATISSGSSDEVVLPSGTKVSFDGAFEDASGIAYSGNVSVAMYHLETSNDNLGNLMPGMLYGETEAGDEAMLKTFGMLNVELRGSGGQKLQIADGHTAGIEMLIDPSQTATAPQTIPLWHFDESFGYWKQQGVANKVGNKYVGEVSHFSWWNCDDFSSVVNMTVNVITQSGEAVSNIGVGLQVSSGTTSILQYTDSNGSVSGIVPANTAMTLNIYNSCGEIIYTSDIGPYSADVVVPTITLTSVPTLTVEGNLTSCLGSTVTNGYVLMDYGTQSIFVPVTDGSFTFFLFSCVGSPDNFTLSGFNYVDVSSTGAVNYAINNPVINVGTISTCNTVTEYITYSNEGGPLYHIFENITTEVNGSSWTLHGEDGSTILNITGIGSAPGTYEQTLDISGSGFENIFMGPSSIQLVVTNYGPVGGYIDFTFSGYWETYFNSQSGFYVSGVGHIIRDN